MKQVVLKQHAVGEISTDNFEVVTKPIPKIEDGEFYIQNFVCGTDPYMRISMNPVEIKFIQLLSSEPFVSASMLNEILSDKEYSKSHLTELRDKFILKLKSKIESLTGEKDGVYETKHKDDKRIKGYKANGAFKKKTSFIVHLFKIK